MSWLALLLIGYAVTDLAFSARPGRVVPQVVGATAAVLVALVAGLTDSRDLAALIVVVGLVLAWGAAVTWGFGRGTPWVPLALFAGSVALALVVAPYAGTPDGLLADWLALDGAGRLGEVRADKVLLCVGAIGTQLSTGNVLVRLVLAATGTLNPTKSTDQRLLEGPAHSLKGGRLLGPMERVFIVGLGLAGDLTAASIVVAAKGLLRFPELQAARDEKAPGPGIHTVTEYFLVGSFASWLLALGSLVLLHW
ncbi:MAG: hypothetical protein ACI379_08220 [Nocardioides sp.]|uniref:hypothetical protein n=1 Tax=Nocardioides sp. TaxID=35761 RepID=UPI003F0FF266